MNISVKINVRETPTAMILEVAGRITLGSPGPSIQDGVRELLDGRHKNIIVDLGGVISVDSSGLGQLITPYTTTVSRGGEIKFINLNKRISDLMQITKLNTIFSIYIDEATALESFEATSVPAYVALKPCLSCAGHTADPLSLESWAPEHL